MLVNNNSSSPQFCALRLGSLAENGKSKVHKCFPASYHFSDLQKASVSQVENPYDVVVSLLKKGSKKVVARVMKPLSNGETEPVVLASVYPRKGFLSRADENMRVVKAACDKANNFNCVV